MNSSTARAIFPSAQPGKYYLTDAGIETELQFNLGYELPHFCAFVLLDNPKAVQDIKALYRKLLDVAANYQFPVLLGGLDYRASPDWGALVGYNGNDLRDMIRRCIGFLDELADEYHRDIPQILLKSWVGPRGDAYERNEKITAEEAEEYHAFQLEVIADTSADLALAGTFNNVPEAIGVVRAATRIGVPIAVSFSLDSDSRLMSGATLREAIEITDRETDRAADFYGINCSHPDEFLPALDNPALTGDVSGDRQWIERIRLVRPNAARSDKLSLCSLGHLESGDPVELGIQMGELARRFKHVDIVGGCCGTWDQHIEQMAMNLVNLRSDQKEKLDADETESV